MTHNDIIEAELAKEIESARLFRLLTKLSTVVDRAELNGDFGWAEYGDRYMLKLFRDYVFHQVRPKRQKKFSGSGNLDFFCLFKNPEFRIRFLIRTTYTVNSSVEDCFE